MPQRDTINLLVESLPVRIRRQLIASAEYVDLDVAAILCQPDARQPYVYFPCEGFVSYVAKISSHPSVGIALIGREGMIGATMLSGVVESPLQGVVQRSGTALRINSTEYGSLLEANLALQQLQNRYLYILLAQLAHSLACTRFHEVEQRLAKWLLMIHDRAGSDQFHLTHQFLANMLGVQRSAVTIAAGGLQQKNLISYSRGEIILKDRQGLEAASCECYEITTAHHFKYFSKS